MEPVVSLSSAVVLLGRFPALAGVDLRVDPGEIVHLHGPNGAGKTTILRTCAGLLPIRDGEATVLGYDLKRDRVAVRRHVGYLGHDTFLYDDLTVDDNLRFWARAGGAGKADVDAASEQLALSGRVASLSVSQLSAGQRRRVALAVVVARRAKVWLLDEPHAGVDAEGRDFIDELLVDAASAGATIVIASHELERAGAVATRVLTVAGGQVRAGATRSLRSWS